MTTMKANTLVTAVDFAVPTNYGIGDRFPSFAEAVEAARATIECFTYPGQGKDGADAVRYSRAFIHMRQVEPVQDRPGAVRSGCDGILARWEVFVDGTIRGEAVE